MNSCDLCGKVKDLFRVRIEGSLVHACKACSRFGQVLSSLEEIDIAEKIKKVGKPVYAEKIETIVSGFKEIIRNEREKKGLKQEELAKELNEKESVIHKVENGHMVLSLKLAQKLERFFKVKLIEVDKNEDFKIEHEDLGEITLGDVIKQKRTG